MKDAFVGAAAFLFTLLVFIVFVIGITTVALFVFLIEHIIEIAIGAILIAILAKAF